jgi:chromosome partitioning protein
MPTVTIALLCQKGGAGKSTLALHLAVEASAAGRRVVLLDLDPQASSARWADRRGPDGLAVDVAVESPARLDVALAQAARAANLVLIPSRCSIFDLDAIGTSLDLCTLAGRPALVILNAAPIRSCVVQEAADTVIKMGGAVANSIVRERVAYRHSLITGQVAREYEPGGAAAAEIAALYVETCERVNTPTSEAA